jgi:hypothetical protein
LTSSDIAKAGFGIINDACVVWEDLRTDMRNVIDVGLMVRLWKVDDHLDENFLPMAMDVAMKEALGRQVDKAYQKADWKVRPHEAKKLCKLVPLHLFASLTPALLFVDAALDAAISLRLHDLALVHLQAKSAEIGRPIPVDWYTFNTRLTEAVRLKVSVRGLEIPWSAKDCTWYSGGKFQGRHF